MPQNSENQNIALIVAAGRGHRFSASDGNTSQETVSPLPKQYQPLNLSGIQNILDSLIHLLRQKLTFLTLRFQTTNLL